MMLCRTLKLPGLSSLKWSRTAQVDKYGKLGDQGFNQQLFENDFADAYILF